MNFKLLISSLFLLTLFISCTIEDELGCINNFDCLPGFSCIDGVCIDNGAATDKDSLTSPDESTVDNSQNDNSVTPDENKDEATDENTDLSDDISDDLSDEALAESDETTDEVTDETTDDLSDDLSDEVLTESEETPDEMPDETPDENTAVTCSTLTCGSNAHCEDYTGTAECVCDSFYQDEDGNGTCLETCILFDCNDMAWGASNDCSIINGAPVCDCDYFAGYTGTHCTECRSGYHVGGFGYEDECFEDNCEEATDNFHGWLDCWSWEECRDTFGYAECW
jgi:hypothetical protein